MCDASSNISEHSVSVVHCFTFSHTHKISHRTSLYCLSHTKYCVYNWNNFLFSIFNFFNPTSGLTDLILNSIHSSRSRSDNLVTGLLSHRKIVVWFPVVTREYSVLNFPHTVSYRVPGSSSLGIKRPEHEADHHLVSRIQREHAILPTLSTLQHRAA
jgi:hypothetical protein